MILKFICATVCLYAKLGLKSLHENFSRRQKQTPFSDAGFLGVLRIKPFAIGLIGTDITEQDKHNHFHMEWVRGRKTTNKLLERSFLNLKGKMQGENDTSVYTLNGERC